MNSHIITPEVCGNCKFSKKPSTVGLPDEMAKSLKDKIECWGLPPSVHIQVVGRSARGQPILMKDNIRPTLSMLEPACSLFKVDLLSSHTPVTPVLGERT